MTLNDGSPLTVPERALAMLRPTLIRATSPADEAFIQLRDGGLQHNDKVLAAMPDEEWKGRGDELLARYPEPDPPFSLESFLRLPGVVELVTFVHEHRSTAGVGKDRTCAAVMTGHHVGRLLVSAGLRPHPEEERERGRLRKAGVRWMPAVALVDELLDGDEIWLPCPTCEDVALAASGGLVRRESDLASASSRRRVVLASGHLLR